MSLPRVEAPIGIRPHEAGWSLKNIISDSNQQLDRIFRPC